MTLYINTGEVDKILAGGSHGQHKLVVPPRGCISHLQLVHRDRPPPYLTRLESVVGFLKEVGGTRLWLKRSFAMGDVLMLIPVIRTIRDNHPEIEVTVVTPKRYHQVMAAAGATPVLPRKITGNRRWDLLVDLDATLEVDHDGGAESYTHRVDIYHDVLGLPRIERTERELTRSWTIEVPGHLMEWAYNALGEGYPIALQWAGSHRCKTLGAITRDVVFGRLTSRYSTLIIDSSLTQFAGAEYFTAGMAELADPDTQVLRLIALLSFCHAAVVMDSGPLWLSHVAGIPIIGLLGPTRYQERLSMHQNKAYGIDMAKMVNCQPCFESAHACGSTYTCMNPPEEALYQEIASKIEALPV